MEAVKRGITFPSKESLPGNDISWLVVFFEPKLLLDLDCGGGRMAVDLDFCASQGELRVDDALDTVDDDLASCKTWNHSRMLNQPSALSITFYGHSWPSGETLSTSSNSARLQIHIPKKILHKNFKLLGK